VNAPRFFPPGDVGEEDAGAHDVAELAAELSEGRGDPPDGGSGLLGEVASVRRLAVDQLGGGAGDRYPVSDTYRARVSDHRFPARTAGQDAPLS
jgi:hypothetical protein